MHVKRLHDSSRIKSPPRSYGCNILTSSKMGRSTSEFKARKDYKYFAHNSRYPDVESAVADASNTESLTVHIPETILHPSQSDAAVTTPSNPAHQITACEPLDLFGSLSLDIQIEILGYVAVNRPAQILHMRRVSCPGHAERNP